MAYLFLALCAFIWVVHNGDRESFVCRAILGPERSNAIDRSSTWVGVASSKNLRGG